MLPRVCAKLRVKVALILGGLYFSDHDLAHFSGFNHGQTLRYVLMSACHTSAPERLMSALRALRILAVIFWLFANILIQPLAIIKRHQPIEVHILKISGEPKNVSAEI